LKIQVIGAGVVGQATGRGFARLGHEVYFYDVDEKVIESLEGEGYQRGIVIRGADVYFVCVPEGVVKETVASWSQPGRLIVIRSTVPPGTAEGLAKVHTCHVCSNPEFLREAVSEYDFLNPPGIIIGACCEEHKDLLRELYEPFRKPIQFIPRKVAELTKLCVNGYLACQISYWNQVKLLADKLGINSQEVGMLASYGDARVSTYGARMHGRPYGGKCLPKDLTQLINLSIKLGSPHYLLGSIRDINNLMEEHHEDISNGN